MEGYECLVATSSIVVHGKRMDVLSDMDRCTRSDLNFWITVLLTITLVLWNVFQSQWIACYYLTC